MKRTYSKQEKLAAIERLENGEPDDLVKEMVRRWRDELHKYGAQAFSGYGKRRRPVPQKTMVLVFRLRQPEYERFLACLESSGARTVSEFARRQLFAPEPDPQQIERRIADLTETVKRLGRCVARS